MQMQVAKLTIKNFMAIKELEITADKFNQITGKNKQGKTSVLRAIETIFTGSTDGRFIKHGEEQAELIFELGDERIRRVLKKDGHTVSITKGEFSIKSPKAYLENMMDFRAFNPLSFLEPENRKTAILQALNIKVDAAKLSKYSGEPIEKLPEGIDYSMDGLAVLKRAYEFYYARRAEANKDALTKENRWKVEKEKFTEPVAPPFTRDEVQARKDAYNAKKTEFDKKDAAATAAKQYNQNAQSKIEDFERQRASLKVQMEQKEKELEELVRRYNGAELSIQETKTLLQPVPEVDPNDYLRLNTEKAEITAQVQQVQAYEAQLQTADIIKGLEFQFKEAKAVADHYDTTVLNLRNASSLAIKESDLPIEGIEVLGEEFYLNGTHFDNLSTSEAALLGLAIAQILAKDTKLICIDKWEMMDTETRAAFIANARTDEFIYFFADVEGEPMEGAQTITMKEGAAV